MAAKNFVGRLFGRNALIIFIQKKSILSNWFKTLLNRKILLFTIGILFILASFAAGQFLPRGVDWYLTFRPATQALLSGNSPYEGLPSPFAGAPWGLVPLIPLAVLPENIGRGFLFVGSIFAFAYAAYRLAAKPVALIAFLLSPPVLHCLINANLDWLPIIGFVSPPAIGLFLLAVKPQMGIIVALFWLVEAWKKGRWKEVIHIFGPVMVAFFISIVLYGFWPLKMLNPTFYTQWWNASLWPMSIPVGLALTVAAIRRHNIKFAMAASPCLSPHVLFHSWSGALASIVASTPETVAAVIGLWILVIIRALSGA